MGWYLGAAFHPANVAIQVTAEGYGPKSLSDRSPIIGGVSFKSSQGNCWDRFGAIYSVVRVVFQLGVGHCHSARNKVWKIKG
jgi:hypothetical protein